MVMLLEKTSALSAVKSTNVATIKSVLAKLQAEVTAASTTTGTVPPEIAMRADAQDKANRLNVTNQAVIGTKEGTTAAFTELIDSNITDTVLRTADGKDFKLIDNYKLEKIFVAVVSGANRPAAIDILKQLVEVLSFQLDFQKKVHANVELLRSKPASMETYSVNMDDTQIALTILTNIKIAAREDYGRKFVLVVQTIQRIYVYSHIHDNTSVAVILKELDDADMVRRLKDATTASNLGRRSNTKAMSNSVSYFQSLIQDTATGRDDGYATSKG